MNDESSIPALETRLNSGDIAIQVAALEEAKKLVTSVSKAAVRGFEFTNAPAIYADWLSRFGLLIIPDLEALHCGLDEGEVKTNVAIVLLYLGSKAGLSDVLRALAPDNPCALMAATQLASAGITEAVEPIANLLKDYAFKTRLDYTVAPAIGNLICALEKLKAPIPTEVKERMAGPNADKFVKAYLPKD